MKRGIARFGIADRHTGSTANWEPVSRWFLQRSTSESSVATATPLPSQQSSQGPVRNREGMAEMQATDAEPIMDGGATFAPPASPSQQRPGDRAVTVLWSFGKCLGALLPVYLAGYYGFSISLVLFGLLLFMGWKHSRLDKMMRLKSAMYLLENENAFTSESVFRAKRDLPPRVRSHELQRICFGASKTAGDSTVSTNCAVTSCFTPAQLPPAF